MPTVPKQIRACLCGLGMKIHSRWVPRHLNLESRTLKLGALRVAGRNFPAAAPRRANRGIKNGNFLPWMCYAQKVISLFTLKLGGVFEFKILMGLFVMLTSFTDFGGWFLTTLKEVDLIWLIKFLRASVVLLNCLINFRDSCLLEIEKHDFTSFISNLHF